MDNFEMVEKLVSQTGVSFEEAKKTLEKTDWNILDAVILLEQQGKIKDKTGSYTSKRVKPDDEPIELEDYDPRDGNADFKHAKRTGKNSDGGKRFGETLKRILLDNRLLVFNGSGAEVVNIPIVGAVIIFCVAFWFVLIAVLLSLSSGWRYQFSGSDLGKDSVNKAADAVGDAVEKMSSSIKDKINEHKNKEQ